MKGVILAAGKGSRLYPVTHHIAKPLLPIANRPTLHYAFDRLREMDVREICIVVGENEEEMKAALGNGEALQVELCYAKQDEPKGLAHAMACAKSFLGDDDFVMYLGDAIYGDSLEPIAAKFRSSGAANVNLVKPVDDPSRFGVANVEGDRITRLVEKPKQPESNLAMAGVYFFSPAIWTVLPELQPSARGEYEITDAIQMLVDRGESVLAGVYEGQWFDTGTLDSYLESSRFLTGGGVQLGNGAIANTVIGDSTVIGEGAFVTAASITDSVVLPGAVVEVSGAIEHSIIGGRVTGGDIKSQIVWGE